MKKIISISALMLAFGFANAKNINLPADQPQASASSEKAGTSYMLDSLQMLTESTPLKGIDDLHARVQQKLIEMQVADTDCTSKK